MLVVVVAPDFSLGFRSHGKQHGEFATHDDVPLRVPLERADVSGDSLSHPVLDGAVDEHVERRDQGVQRLNEGTRVWLHAACPCGRIAAHASTKVLVLGVLRQQTKDVRVLAQLRQFGCTRHLVLPFERVEVPRIGTEFSHKASRYSGHGLILRELLQIELRQLFLGARVRAE